MRAFSLVFLIMLCQGVGLLGAKWTAPQISTWYVTLVKPSFNPPGWIFAPVWTTLYLLMAIAAWQVMGTAPSSPRNLALILFGVQLMLNLAWPWVFFSRHALWAAFAEIILMWIATIGATIMAFGKMLPIAAALMAPYWAWVSFAALLNGAIARMNPA